jgi:hypothetical protein
MRIVQLLSFLGEHGLAWRLVDIVKRQGNTHGEDVYDLRVRDAVERQVLHNGFLRNLCRGGPPINRERRDPCRHTLGHPKDRVVGGLLFRRHETVRN